MDILCIPPLGCFDGTRQVALCCFRGRLVSNQQCSDFTGEPGLLVGMYTEMTGDCDILYAFFDVAGGRCVLFQVYVLSITCSIPENVPDGTFKQSWSAEIESYTHKIYSEAVVFVITFLSVHVMEELLEYCLEIHMDEISSHKKKKQLRCPVCCLPVASAQF